MTKATHSTDRQCVLYLLNPILSDILTQEGKTYSNKKHMFYLKGPWSTCYCWWTISYNQFIYVHVTTLPETNISPEIELPKRKVLFQFQPSIFRGYVGFRRVIVKSYIKKWISSEPNLHFYVPSSFSKVVSPLKISVFVVGKPSFFANLRIAGLVTESHRLGSELPESKTEPWERCVFLKIPITDPCMAGILTYI